MTIIDVSITSLDNVEVKHNSSSQILIFYVGQKKNQSLVASDDGNSNSKIYRSNGSSASLLDRRYLVGIFFPYGYQ